MKEKLILFLFVILSFTIRIYGLNWDQGQHLHPDERFLTMVETTIQLPDSVNQYFDTVASPLNPFNYTDYHFFVYGTFPLFLTKTIGHITGFSGYNQIHLVGRILSALFDSINIITLYFLTRILIKTKKKLYIFLPSFFYLVCVLPLQLSHFFAVDTFLNAFLLLTFTFLVYFSKNNKLYFLIISSIFWGLALSSKISAIYFVPVIVLFFLFHFMSSKKNFRTIFLGLIFILFSFLTFRIFQPYAFSGIVQLNPMFINSLKTLHSLSRLDVFFPPSVQWLSTTPIVFPLKNIILFGLGLPFSFFSLFIVIKSLFKTKAKFDYVFFILIFWIIFLFIFQGIQSTYSIRYFLPIYPFVFVLVSILAQRLKISRTLIIITLAFHFSWGLSFLSIYSHSHSRVESSYWIYQNLPANSFIKNEYWDDPLPLFLPEYGISPYDNQQLHLYDPDTPEKWQNLTSQINTSDYLIMSSNRLWGSIPKVPLQYPQTSKYYQNLFDEKLNFKLVKKIVSYPGFSLPIKKCVYIGPTDYPGKFSVEKWIEIDPSCSIPGIYFRDDIADESFTVYDHPQVLIFQKK